MQQNKFGEMIFNETDVCDLLMQGRSIESFQTKYQDKIRRDDNNNFDEIINIS